MLDYGILSLQKEQSQFSVACSDGHLRMVADCDTLEVGSAIKVSEDSILYHDVRAQRAVCGTLDGNVHLVDMGANKVTSEGLGVHNFSIWYASFSKDDENLLYTGADDSAFKKFDTRVGFGMPVYQNRKYHSAGVTFVRQLKQVSGVDSALLLTGSYDCSIAAWDERKLGREPVEVKSTDGKSVWDIKINPQHPHDWGVASIYDGYLFDINNAGSKALTDLNFVHFSGHESICYAFEWVQGLSPPGRTALLTSSFYDNTLKLIYI